MWQMRDAGFSIGPVAVRLRTGAPGVLDYLSNFYTRNDAALDATEWTVDARIGEGRGMRRNNWGVGYHADPERRLIRLRAREVRDLAITARKCIRDVMVAYCETQRYTMLHASAVADDQCLLIMAGDKGAGKTTLALRAVMEHGFRYVSNDHLIVYRNGRAGGALAVTSLPTLIPVKVGTYLDLEHVLPEPWDTEQLDIGVFRAMPAAERYQYDRRVLYTYRRLGQKNPLEFLLDHEPRISVSVIFVGYAPPGGPVGRLEPEPWPSQALLDQVRFDWPFDPLLNTQYVPRLGRDRAGYAADARKNVSALAACALTMRWSHRGDVKPLLAAFDRKWGRT